MITAVLLLCTDDDDRSYRNVCNMSFVSRLACSKHYNFFDKLAEFASVENPQLT